MALLPLNLDYTDKDFSAIRSRLYNLISSSFPEWTDREVANFGNIMVELFSFAADVILFYQDNQAKESRWSDADLRKSVIALAKMLNYVPEGNAAATADVLFSLSTPPVNDVFLAAGRIYRTAEQNNVQAFQQIGDVTMQAGQDPPQVFVIVENSVDAEEQFAATGLPNQEITLAGVPFLDTSLVLTATNGGYEQVDNFLNSTAIDRHYTVTVDESGRALVRFGNGINGELPTGNIDAFYKTGGGAAGNVDENTITAIDGTVTDVLGNRVNPTVTNPEAANGGVDRESISSIKQKGPPSTKVTDRTVALDDYEIGAENVAGVARALMVTSDQIVGVPENRGFLYLVPDGGGSPTDTLKTSVEEAVTVTRPNTITFKVTAESAGYLTVDVVATIYFADGVSKRGTVTLINTALEEYFQITNPDGTKNELVKFGLQYGGDYKLPMSDLFCVVEAITGVRKIGARDVDFLLNLVHDDVLLQFFEFPELGTVTITDGDTGSVVLPL